MSSMGKNKAGVRDGLLNLVLMDDFSEKELLE